MGAIYQGMPYLHTLDATFNSKIISALTYKSIQIGLVPSPREEEPRFELAQAQKGIPLLVAFSSTSSKTEMVLPRLENMPGFILEENTAQPVAANGDTTLTLHLLGDPSLQSQIFLGHLVFSASDSVDLVGADVPLALELYTPTLSIKTAVTVGSPSPCCWNPVAVILNLSLTSTSTQIEQVKLHLDGMAGASLNQETITVQPGTSQVKLSILSSGKAFTSGEHTGKLIIDGMRSGYLLSNDSSLVIAFQIQPIWATCRKSMIISGVIIILGVIIAVALKKRFTHQPVIIKGTLIHWNQATPEEQSSEYLSEYKKSEIKIGKGPQNNIVIPDESIAEEHILIKAEYDENNNICLIIHPLAPIHKGYRQYTDDLPLEENVEYMMGNRKFKFVGEL